MLSNHLGKTEKDNRAYVNILKPQQEKEQWTWPFSFTDRLEFQDVAFVPSAKEQSKPEKIHPS